LKDILLTSQIFCHAERAWETQSRNKQLWVTWGVSTPSDFRKASLPPQVVRATHGNTMGSFHVFNCFLEKKTSLLAVDSWQPDARLCFTDQLVCGYGEY